MGKAKTIGEITADKTADLSAFHVKNYGISPNKVYVSREVYKSWKDEAKTLIRPPQRLSEIAMFMGMEIVFGDCFHDPIVSREEGSIQYLAYHSFGNPRSATIHTSTMDYLRGVPSIHERGMFNNIITLKENRYFENGTMHLNFQINGVSIRPIGISLTGNELESIKSYTERAYATHKAIPVNAKVIPSHQLNEFNGKLIAGWLFDSQCKVYGIKQHNGTIRGYSCAICWVPTDEELVQLTSYPEIKGE